MRISDWKPFTKNTLKEFFTCTLNSGLVIHKLSLHEKKGSRWVGLPAEKYSKHDGTTAYAVLIEFESRGIANSFRDQVLEALKSQGIE